MPFHLANVVYHALASVLFLALLGQLGFSPGLSLAGALALAVHPAIAEAVYWIPGRCDLFLGIGFLLATSGFIAYAREKHSTSLWVHLGGLGVALLSKESAVVIPVVLASYVLLVERRAGVLRDPWIVAGWATLLLIWQALRSSSVGAAGGEGVGGRLEAVLLNLPVLLIHLGKVLVPIHLAVLAYSRDSSMWPGLVGLVAIVGAVSRVSGARRRLAAWGVLVFAIVLFPTLTVSDFLILENRLYVAAMGIVVVGLVVVERLLNDSRPPVRAGAAFAAVSVIGGLCLATGAYGRAFESPESFTTQAVATSPHLALAHLNRGIVLQRDGRVSDAEREYRTALGLDSSQTVVHNNLGLIEMNRGALEQAQALIEQEIALNPRYDEAHFNLGLILARQGRLQDALVSWREALRLNPDNEDARLNLEEGRGDPRARGTDLAGEPTQVSADEIPAELLVSLYQDALKKQPGNEAIRQAYLDLCRRRRLPCGESR